MSASLPNIASAPPPGPLQARYEELERKFLGYRPNDNIELLRDAYALASELHATQVRRSGEPYLSHPIEVSHQLADLRLDQVCLAAGLLHDVVEDTPVTVPDLKARFGPEVALCVDGVTKLGRIDFFSSEARQAENFRKMLLAMVEDIRVILIKLADRTHNMRTLGYLSAEKQEKIARETIEIYAPIALRLGMGKIRSELEDLAFSYLEPEPYREITAQIEQRREASEDFLAHIKEKLTRKLAEVGVPSRIDGRIKRAYSIYQKLKRQRISIDQVYDLLALRVITDTQNNCYAVLGVIHSQWRPVPGRIKDFIAMPRPNLYQSLHTSVITDAGQTFEVQIRSERMHLIAEDGIAAHWKYKEGRQGVDGDDRRMAWLRQLVEWQREMKDPGDFLSTLKIDLYPEEVYVFTPHGKLVVLPRDATPIDFAYAIHTEVGNTCVGAKVNGRIVPLRYKLRNGDIIEVITQQGHTPSRDWLSVVRTSRARNKIKHWLNVNQRMKAQEIGQKLLEKEARRANVSLRKVPVERMQKVSSEYGCAAMEDLYVALGFGRFSARQIIAKLAPQPEPAEQPADPRHAQQPAAPKPASGDRGVLKVKGIDDLLVYRARCCNPIRGEEIVGYVTRGKGVAVHSKSCPNVDNLMYEAERRIEVEWEEATTELTYRTRLIIYAVDRPGILNELTGIVSGENVNIASIETRETNKPEQLAIIELTMELEDVTQLDRIVAAMRRLRDVREVTRSHRN